MLSRRAFLGGTAAAVLAAACGGGDDGAAAPDTSTTTASTNPPVTLPGPPFTLGVASGDPQPDRVIIWTRLAPEPRTGGGMPAQPVDVSWEMASDSGFTTVVQSGRAVASPDLAHAVHVDVTGLDPATAYWYRFTVGDEVSPVGRTRTLPGADDSPDALRFAVGNCQHFELGYYAAYRHMAGDDLDLVLFLGDYIYEFPAGDPPRQSAPDGFTETLDDYRNRYASYKTDADLQAAHAAFPWVVTWDDHEVSNNYEGDTDEAGSPPDVVRARRAAAYRAWYEHMPVRMDPPSDADVTVYRDVAFGDLARLFVLDERQYGDVPPCRGEPGVVADVGNCAALEAADSGDFLGPEQEGWLYDGLASSTATWNIIGNPVMLAGLNAGTADAPSYFLESWDGHPAARLRLLDQLAAGGSGVSNPVVVTGDYHAGFVNDVHQVPFDQSSPVVATELLSPAISSALFPTDYTALNPHVKYFVARHGYLRCTVEADRLTAEYQLVSDVQDPDATIATDATWVITAGSPEAVRA